MNSYVLVAAFLTLVIIVLVYMYRSNIEKWFIRTYFSLMFRYNATPMPASPTFKPPMRSPSDMFPPRKQNTIVTPQSQNDVIVSQTPYGTAADISYSNTNINTIPTSDEIQISTTLPIEVATASAPTQTQSGQQPSELDTAINDMHGVSEIPIDIIVAPTTSPTMTPAETANVIASVFEKPTNIVSKEVITPTIAVFSKPVNKLSNIFSSPKNAKKTVVAPLKSAGKSIKKAFKF